MRSWPRSAIGTGVPWRPVMPGPCSSSTEMTTGIPLDGSREWRRSFPNARLAVVPNAGHFIWLEQPEAFFGALEPVPRRRPTGRMVVACARASMIARDGGIDFEAPAVDAAGHAHRILQSLAAQPLRDLQAAHAMVAEQHQLSIAGAQRLQRLRHAAHGNQFRARDMGLLMLERFAHVHHANLFACIEAPLDFTWIDLYCRHVALRRPYISRLTPRRNRDLGASHRVPIPPRCDRPARSKNETDAPPIPVSQACYNCRVSTK